MTSFPYLIEKMVHGGFGLSHDQEGKVLLIEGVIAGETVKASLLNKGKAFDKGRVTEILLPSAHRTAPPAPSTTDAVAATSSI